MPRQPPFAQVRRSFNPQVAGSSPAGGTIALCALRITAPATGRAVARWQCCACADGATSGASAVCRQGRSRGHRFPPGGLVETASWVGPVTVGELGCSSTNFVLPERSAARGGPRTKSPGGNHLQCSGEPSGSACQATPSGRLHKPVRKREFGVAEE